MATSQVFRRGVEILRARRLAAQAAAQAEQAAAQAAAQAEAEAYHAEWYDRQRAADFLGLSTHKLKRLMAAGTGPSCSKSGPSKQSPVRWNVADLRAWKAAQAVAGAPRHPTPESETGPNRARG